MAKEKKVIERKAIMMRIPVSLYKKLERHVKQRQKDEGLTIRGVSKSSVAEEALEHWLSQIGA